METREASITQRLREETRDGHKHAEERPLERALLGGTLPQGVFVEHLTQRLVIHETLEHALRDAAGHDERIGAIFLEDQHQARNIEADLQFFGVDASRRQPLPSTMAAVRDIELLEQRDAPALLGVLYVFEGSKNGARFVANQLRLAYKLTDGKGLQYFNPHGDKQRPTWEEFKRRCDEARLTPAEADAIVAAAKLTFVHLAVVDDEVFSGISPLFHDPSHF